MSKFIDKINLPKTIKKSEAGFYHVIIVEANFSQAKLEAFYKSRVQIYDERSWYAVKDRLKQIGHTNVYVLHDPTIEGVDEDLENLKKNLNIGTQKEVGTEVHTDAGSEEGEKEETPKEKRARLIATAKQLGYEGNLNAKNVDFEDYIARAIEHGDAGSEE